jgi:5-methylcytosine-specific restriction endonuclease McrA
MHLHLPWWVWALGALVLVVYVLEEQQRAARKAKHRAYLRSPEWKARRKEALLRAGGRCMDCGASKNLHVHHLTYKRHGNELARDLRVLCNRCHRKRHREGGRSDDLFDRFVGWVADKAR